MLGTHTLKTWAQTQAVVALSSGEAEYYGMVKAATVGLGMRTLMKDLQLDKTIRIKTDASAAKGIANRTGLGKMRHLEVTQLWLQEKVRNGDVTVQKVDGKINRADAGTKHVTREELERTLRWLGCYKEHGRHDLAPGMDTATDCGVDDEDDGSECGGITESESESSERRGMCRLLFHNI